MLSSHTLFSLTDYRPYFLVHWRDPDHVRKCITGSGRFHISKVGDYNGFDLHDATGPPAQQRYLPNCNLKMKSGPSDPRVRPDVVTP